MMCSSAAFRLQVLSPTNHVLLCCPFENYSFRSSGSIEYFCYSEILLKPTEHFVFLSVKPQPFMVLVLVFTALAPKCKVIRERDTKSLARRTPFFSTHPYRETHKGQPQHRELHALLFSNSVWVL